MTWHQWHHTAPMSSSIGLSSALACAKASSFHSCQSIGWCAAERRYGLVEFCRRFAGCSVKNARFESKQLAEVKLWRLLHGVVGPQVARIDRLAAGEAFILAMIVANAIFAEFPAEIDLFVINDRRKIEQPDVQVLDNAAGFQNLVERRFQRLGQPRMLAPQLGQRFVRYDESTHHHNSRC